MTYIEQLQFHMLAVVIGFIVVVWVAIEIMIFVLIDLLRRKDK